MVRGNMMRMAWVAASVAMVVSGCTCDPTEVSCTDTTISFETPTEGAAVDSPFDVSFSVKAPDGTAFNLDAATLKVDGKTIDGTISGNRASFAGVTAAAGAQSLVATIARGTCSKTAAPVNVTVNNAACTTPAVTEVTFPQDTNGSGVLNATELPPGTNLDVRVTATCVSGAQVRIKRGADVVGTLTSFVNGVATVTTSLPDSDNARYDVFAELVKDGVAVNTASGNPEGLGSIEVSRTPPAVALTVDPVWGPNDDANTAMSGFQVRVTGSAPQNTSCTLGVNGETPVTVVPSMTGDVSADFTLVSGSYTATLTCTDTAGNTATATATFVVDFAPPTVTITSPANVDGGATGVVTQSPLAVTIATVGAEDGSVVIVRRDGNDVGNGTITNGAATVDVSFSMDGTYTIEVEVTDAAGNKGTASISVLVSLSGCGAAFVRPITCPRLLTSAQVINGQYTAQISSKAICSGQPARLYRVDYLADGGAQAEITAGSTTVAATGTSTFPPIALTSGEYDLRAEVTNLGDAGVAVSSTGVCHVTVDLNGPAIISPVVPSNATYAVVNAAQDTQPGVPGVQRSLTFSGLVPVGGRVDVCTTQATDPSRPAADGGFELRQTSTECEAGWYVLQQGVASPVNSFTFPDGTYDIKVVVIGGGQVLPSAAVAILSDSVRPCVSGLTRRLPQDTSADNRLNIAELGGAAPQLEFALGCGDTPTSLAATNAVVVRDLVGGVAAAVRPSSAAFAAGKYTLSLTGAYATEVDLNLFVELTDLAGNRNNLVVPVDPGTFQFRVDPVVPACDLLSPGASQTLVGQAGVTGGMFPVSVSTASDVATNGVRVTFGTTAARDLTPANNVAATSYAVTGTNTYAVTAVCTDQSGNATTATARSITIDLDAPTCSITSPTASTYAVNQIATAISVGGAEGRPVTVRSSLQGAPLGSLNVSGGVATGNISYPNGTQTVTAEVSDLAGNLCTATVAGLIVNSTSCGLTLTNVFTNSAGNWFNRSNTGSLTATTGVIANLTANSADCRSGQTVSLQRTTPAGAAVTSTTAANGDVAFTNVAVSDGEAWSVTINNGTGILTTQTFRVGLRVPTATGVTINGNAITSGQDLFFVAPSGNINLEPAAGTPKLTTYFADGVSGTAGSQTNVAVTGISGARVGTDNGLVEVRYGAGAVVSQAVNAEPFDLASTQMTLAHNTTGSFVVRVTSAAGNTVDVVANNAAVDVLAPNAPAVTPSLASARAATVNLSWAPVFDDGTAGSGDLTGGPATQLAGYDVRWTTSSVPSNNGLATVADFFGSSSKQDGIAAYSSATIVRAVSGLPPINTYFLGVRARDEVGNYSDFAGSQSVPNPWSIVTLSAPVASSSFGSSLQSAALIGNDGLADLVVAAPLQTSGGAVYVYNSTALAANQTTCGAGCQVLTASTTVGSQFGHDLAVGNVGAVATETVSDLLVAGLGGVAPVFGRAALYFGTTNATLVPSDAIEFRGLDTNNRIGTSLATSVAIIRDITGDGRDEIAFAAPGQSTNRGRVLIYRGRDRAAWVTLATALDTTVTPNVAYVPVSATTADYVIDGPLPLLVSPAGNAFGQNRRGLVSVNDLDGDTYPDLAIPTSRQTINQYRIVGSAAIKASSGVAPLDTTTGNAQLLSRAVGADNGTTGGLGTAAFGNRDLIDSVAADFATSVPNVSPAPGQVLVYSNFASSPTNPAPTLTLTGPARFGAVVTGGLLDSDMDNDLIVSTDNATANTVWAIFRRTGTYETGTFDTSACFYVARLRGVDVTGNASSRIGSALAVTNGGELVVGDMFMNEVRIWR